MITSKASKWFEAKVRVKRVDDDGLLQHTVTEAYVVDALTWGETEKRVTEEMTLYAGTDFEITDIKPAAYGEVFFSDSDKADKYYKCKLQFITIDEKTAKEKRANVYYLVQAENIDKAKANINEVMGTTMIDYEVVSMVETKFLDVFVHIIKVETKAKPNPATATKTSASSSDMQTVKAAKEYNNAAHEEDMTRKEIPKDE